MSQEEPLQPTLDEDLAADPSDGASEEDEQPELKLDDAAPPAAPSDDGADVQHEPAPHVPPDKGSIGVSVTIGSAEGSHVETIGHKEEHYSEYTILNGYTGDSQLWARDLKADDFDEVLDRDRLQAISASPSLPGHEVEPVAAILKRHRIVFVLGERKVGKGALAQHAASWIAVSDGELSSALVTAGVDRRIRVRPERLFSENGALNGRLLLFENAFQNGHEDLRRLAARMDGPALEALQQRLSQAGAYVLLTSDPSDLDDVPGCVERLERLELAFRVTAPAAELLLATIRERASALQHRSPDSSRAAAFDALLERRGEWLAGCLRTRPRVIDWVDRFLPAVLQGDLSLEESLERLDHLDHWLLRELPTDPPVWHFVLALLLASADARSRWVPLVLMHRLWRWVEGTIERERTQGEVSGPLPLDRLVVDDGFLARARGEIRRHRWGDAVRFEEPALGDQLWRVLLSSGRALMLTLLPAIEELAESSEPEMRRVAARALGRIGELDPASVTLRRFDQWLETRKGPRFAAPLLLGELVVGATLSADQGYGSRTLERLLRATGSEAERSEAAVVALVPLGIVEPQRVLDLLWTIAQKRVSESARDALPLWRQVQERLVQRARSKSSSTTGGVVELAAAEAEEAALATLGSHAPRILSGIQYVLVGLCLAGDHTIRVGRTMSRWMSEDVELAPWVAFLTLRERGLLRIVEDFPVQPPTDDGDGSEDRPCSRVLLAADSAEEIADLVGWIEATYAATAAFPAIFRSWLQSNLLRTFDRWLVQGAETSVVRPRVVSVLGGLLDGDEELLRRDLFARLQRWSRDGRREGPRNLARQILSPL